MDPSNPSKSSPSSDPGEAFSILVMPSPAAGVGRGFSICSHEVSPEAMPDFVPTSSVCDSLDDRMAAVSGVAPVFGSPTLSQHLLDVAGRLLSSLSGSSAPLSSEYEALDTPELHAITGSPRKLSDQEALVWCEYYRDGTGDYLLPDLSQAFDPMFALTHADRGPLSPERFSAGPVRLLVVWNQFDDEISRVSALISEECVEEAIRNFLAALKEPMTESSSCILYRLESSLIDYLRSTGALELPSDLEECRTIVRNSLMSEVSSFSITPSSNHTLQIRVTPRINEFEEPQPFLCCAEIRIPCRQPVDLESIDIQWSGNVPPR
jgi:hypothetical protein